MLFDNITMLEGSEISNLTVSVGADFPDDPSVGELFYIGSSGQGNDIGLYVYSNGDWQLVADAENGGGGSGEVTLTGDITGTGTGSVATTLATVNSSPQSNTFRKVTVNGKGLVIATSAVSPSDLTTALGYTPLNKAGDTMSSGYITLSGDPISALHAVTKQYADSIAAGLDPKGSVRAATTANITLSAPQTIDSISVIAGDRVLVKNQTTGSENGIYVVAAGAWQRAADFDGSPSNEVTGGAYTFVEEGTSNADTGWVLTTNNPITIGSTALTFTQFTGVSGGGTALTNAYIAYGSASNQLTGTADFTWTTGTQTLALGTSSVGAKIVAAAGATNGLTMTITGSAGTGTNVNGGGITLTGGATGTSNGTGGSIILQGGPPLTGSTSSVGGNTTIIGGFLNTSQGTTGSVWVGGGQALVNSVATAGSSGMTVITGPSAGAANSNMTMNTSPGLTVTPLGTNNTSAFIVDRAQVFIVPGASRNAAITPGNVIISGGPIASTGSITTTAGIATIMGGSWSDNNGQSFPGSTRINGGAVNVVGGVGQADSNPVTGGNAVIQGGSVYTRTSGAGTAGSVVITGGTKSANSTLATGMTVVGGNVTIAGGNGAANAAAIGGGNVIINGGVATTSVSGIASGGYIAISTAPDSASPGTATLVERLRILSNGAWSVGTGGTATGTSGQVLTSNGNTSAPTWQTPAGGASDGSFTGNFGGLNPTGTATVYYSVVGKTCTLRIPSITGTSSGTNFYMEATNVPAVCKPLRAQYVPATGTSVFNSSGGATQPNLIAAVDTGGSIDFYINGSGSNWSGSAGNRGFGQGLTITYGLN